jgi:antitoxin component YwqK of YwqJK toxin-antitoxin module
MRRGEDGTLSYRGAYKNGLLFLDNENEPYSGKLSAHYKNGERFTLTEYEAGKLHGERKRWDQKGKIMEIEEYRHGMLAGVKRY